MKPKCRLYFLLFILVSLNINNKALANDESDKGQGHDKKKAVECEGVVYKSKDDHIPVYTSPDETSKVIGKLALGEKVCNVGEEKGFSIIIWPTDYSQKTKKAKSEKVEKTNLAFVKVTDLWAPNLNKSSGGVEGFFEDAKRYYYYIRSGGIPEDPLAPYRPIMNIFSTKTKTESDARRECEESDEQTQGSRGKISK